MTKSLPPTPAGAIQRGLFANDHRREPFTWSLDVETRAEVDRLLEHLDQVLQSISRAKRVES